MVERTKVEKSSRLGSFPDCLVGSHISAITTSYIYMYVLMHKSPDPLNGRTGRCTFPAKSN